MAGSGSPEPRREISKGNLVAFATTAAATATAEFTATAAAAAGGAFFARAGDVDRQRATVHVLAVHAFDGLLGLFGGTHGHKTKAARAVGHAIHHQVGFSDRAKRGERVLQVVFSGIEEKISYE